MKNLPRLSGWTGIIVLIGLMTPAVIIAQKVNVDSNPSAPFATYQTYTWAPGASGLESLTEQRLRESVNQRLAARGLTQTTASPDLVVTAHIKTQERQELIPTGFGYGPWWGGVGGAYVETSMEGTLILDFYDAKTKQMVWRGVATATASDKPTKNIEKMNKALDKMFARFPSTGGAVSTSGRQ
jgi:hypothetical protein